ncbi:hypothetical protein AGMMS4956_15290 [Bacteroidia bacterium]|nr:hypothetical protein AGMMS4956_15290 [Bacteroidia bacterium]
MSVFKSWLIANFEVAISVAGAVVALVIYLIAGSGWSAEGVNFAIFIAITIAPISYLVTPPSAAVKTRSDMMFFLLYLVLLAGLICIPAGVLDNYSDKGITAIVTFVQTHLISILVVFIASSVFGFYLAQYAYKNHQDVVSRRMLYRSSAVDLFSNRWKYTMDRFAFISLSVMLEVGIMVVLITIWV